MKKAFTPGIILLSLITLIACKKSSSIINPPATTTISASLYFPPLSGTDWQTTMAASLGGTRHR